MKTNKLKSNYSVKPIPLTTRLLAFAACACFGLATVASAQTIISGPTIAGGTWSPSGNPYYVTGNCTINSGQTLTIQPGVVVDIAAGVSFTVNGNIQAVGTPSQRITFQSFTPSQFWNEIQTYSLLPQITTNQFEYCDFINANIALVFNNGVNVVTFSTFQNVTNAIEMAAYPYNSTAGSQTVNILNCIFSNCVSQAVYGQAFGAAGGGYFGYSYYGLLNTVIKNCYFSAVGNGCDFYVYGVVDSGNSGYVGSGYASVQIMNNIFNTVSNSAISLTVASYAGNFSEAILINNTIDNSPVGIHAADPWDGQVLDNIFVACTNAVQDTGSLLRNVSFNDFYDNATNFTGYNANYGNYIIPNRNGTISDVVGNIGSDPLFVATNDFHLTSPSPCINAGTADPEYANMCSPPSISTNYPDLGAYGGPDGCNWLDPVPMLPAQLTLTKTNKLLQLNWSAIPRSTYQIQYLATNLDAYSGTNLWLTNTAVIPSAKPFTITVSPVPTTNKTGFYRVRSLGRAVGN